MLHAEYIENYIHRENEKYGFYVPQSITLFPCMMDKLVYLLSQSISLCVLC